MKVVFQENAWEQYCYWQTTDKKILRKINDLIKEISRNIVDESVVIATCRFHYQP